MLTSKILEKKTPSGPVISTQPQEKIEQETYPPF